MDERTRLLAEILRELKTANKQSDAIYARLQDIDCGVHAVKKECHDGGCLTLIVLIMVIIFGLAVYTPYKSTETPPPTIQTETR